MNYLITNDDSNYQVDSSIENPEVIIPIAQAAEVFANIQEQYDIAKAKYEENKAKLEIMCKVANEQIGFKSLKGRYAKVTYIPATEGHEETEKVLDTVKMLNILVGELGHDPEEFYVEQTKTVGARKASIRTR